MNNYVLNPIKKSFIRAILKDVMYCTVVYCKLMEFELEQTTSISIFKNTTSFNLWSSTKNLNDNNT